MAEGTFIIVLCAMRSLCLEDLNFCKYLFHLHQVILWTLFLEGIV